MSSNTTLSIIKSLPLLRDHWAVSRDEPITSGKFAGLTVDAAIGQLSDDSLRYLNDEVLPDYDFANHPLAGIIAAGVEQGDLDTVSLQAPDEYVTREQAVALANEPSLSQDSGVFSQAAGPTVAKSTPTYDHLEISFYDHLATQKPALPARQSSSSADYLSMAGAPNPYTNEPVPAFVHVPLPVYDDATMVTNTQYQSVAVENIYQDINDFRPRKASKSKIKEPKAPALPPRKIVAKVVDRAALPAKNKGLIASLKRIAQSFNTFVQSKVHTVGVWLGIAN